jgi:hypothetical protein
LTSFATLASDLQDKRKAAFQGTLSEGKNRKNNEKRHNVDQNDAAQQRVVCPVFYLVPQPLHWPRGCPRWRLCARDHRRRNHPAAASTATTTLPLGFHPPSETQRLRAATPSAKRPHGVPAAHDPLPCSPRLKRLRRQIRFTRMERGGAAEAAVGL